jgi:hypothetical protein
MLIHVSLESVMHGERTGEKCASAVCSYDINDNVARCPDGNMPEHIMFPIDTRASDF